MSSSISIPASSAPRAAPPLSPPIHDPGSLTHSSENLRGGEGATCIEAVVVKSSEASGVSEEVAGIEGAEEESGKEEINTTSNLRVCKVFPITTWWPYLCNAASALGIRIDGSVSS